MRSSPTAPQNICPREHGHLVVTKKDSIALGLQRAPDPGHAALLCLCGLSWQGREKSISGKCACLLGIAGLMAVPLSLLISKTSTNPSHTGMPLGCSVQDAFRKQASLLQSYSVILTPSTVSLPCQVWPPVTFACFRKKLSFTFKPNLVHLSKSRRSSVPLSVHC